MKKILLSILFLFTVVSVAMAQRHPRPDFEKIQAAKVGMITQRLALTEKQAEKFWPIYHEFSAERKELYRMMRQKMSHSKSSELTEADRNRILDERMQLREKEVIIEKNYKDRFLKVISAEQYINLLDAEKDFHRLLIERARKHE